MEFIAQRMIGPEITNCIQATINSLMVSRTWGKEEREETDWKKQNWKVGKKGLSFKRAFF